MKYASLSKPLISIQMVVRNGQKYIGQALRSALNQTFSNFEVIVVDDFSTDLTRSEVQKFQDNRIKYFFNSTPGLGYARQLALEKSSGYWTAIFDADDISFPNRLELCLKALDTGLVALGGQIEETTEEGLPISRCLLFPLSEAQIRRRLGKGYSLCHGTAIFNTQKAIEVGGYSKKINHIGEDENMFLRLGAKGKVLNLNEFLIQRRIHRQSICTSFQLKNWVILERFFSENSLLEASYWARLGKSALRGKNKQRAKEFYSLSIRHCPCKTNSYLGWLLSAI